jgi:hypothetical protein
MTSSRIAAIASTAILALALAAPADAKPRKHKTRAAVPSVATVAPGYRGANLFPPGPVMYGGNEYLGTDPDPFIRSQLLRDIGAHFGGDN